MARTELDPEDREPLYRQLAEILRGQIASGRIPPRHALPSKRVLMQEYGISAKTVDKAMQVLKDERLAETETGKGIYAVGQPPEG